MGMGRIGMTFVFLILSISACTSVQQSSEERLLLMRKLEAAKQMDEENARGDKSDNVQADDSIYQASQAQRVIIRLQQGQTVTQSEIEDALDVPPESVTPEARTELIKELSIAENRDELGEQNHDPGNDWLTWNSFREQRERADSVSKALQAGVNVPWSEIQQALRVPEMQ